MAKWSGLPGRNWDRFQASYYPEAVWLAANKITNPRARRIVQRIDRGLSDSIDLQAVRDMMAEEKASTA